jgi:hypothetical protein
LPPIFKPSASMTVSAVVITGISSIFFGAVVTNWTVFDGRLDLRVGGVTVSFIKMNLQSLVG